MAHLPNQDNPLYKIKIYEFLQIDPHVSAKELKEALTKYSSLDTLQKKVKGIPLDVTKRIIGLLRRNFSRVLINSLILGKVEEKTIKRYFDDAPKLEQKKAYLPKPDLRLVYVEGKDIETLKHDFDSVDVVSELELDFQELAESLTPTKIDKHFFFET